MAEEGLHEFAMGSTYGWIVAARTLAKAYGMLDLFSPDEEKQIRAYVKQRQEMSTCLTIPTFSDSLWRDTVE
jgi:hypothetical protein